MFDDRYPETKRKLPKVEMKGGIPYVQFPPIDLARFLNPSLVQQSSPMEMVAEDDMDYNVPDYQVANDQYLMDDDDDYDEEYVPSLEEEPISEEEILMAEQMLDAEGGLGDPSMEFDSDYM